MTFNWCFFVQDLRFSDEKFIWETIWHILLNRSINRTYFTFLKHEGYVRQKISVIIPAYNIEKELVSLAVDCLEMTSEIGADGEIVIIDDASTDATPDIAENLSLEYPQIKVISQWQNRGTSNAILKGLSQAIGNLFYVYYVSFGHVFPQISCFYEAMSFTDAVFGRFVSDAEICTGMAMFKRQVMKTLGSHIAIPDEAVSLMKENHIRYLELRYEATNEGNHNNNTDHVKKPVYKTRLVNRSTTLTS